MIRSQPVLPAPFQKRTNDLATTPTKKAAATPAAKKTAVRKPAVKKAAVKKAAVKKAAVKKAAVKKTAAVKRVAAKKVPTKSPVAAQVAAPAAALPYAVAATLHAASPLMQKVQACLDDAKAENIVVIDLQGRTSIADYMVVATGRSTTHVAAIADRIMKMCKEAGFGTPRVEGIPHCDWVLVDTNDVIIHIFRPEVRQFYNLEKLWGGDRPADSSATHAGRA